MPDINRIADALGSSGFDGMLKTLYGEKGGMPAKQKARYLKLIDKFAELYPGKTEIDVFSTPGRTEVGGNHTDHNAGRILAATVNLDALAAASKNDDGVIRVRSEGYPPETLDVNCLSPVEREKYTSTALIRGVCARAKQLGYNVGGFDAYVTSDVLKGSGLSSSAAYEVLIMTILNHFYNGGAVDDITVAMIAQYSENNFFMKPCGLMDMTTCSVGGFVTIDFRDFDNPRVDKVDFDFAGSGHAMVIVDSGGSHADLNEDYTLLEHEMKDVARFFGGQALREFSAELVLKNIAALRGKVSDRAILRALHFFADDQRVVDQVDALRSGAFGRFKELIIESGYSSWMLCQNCYSSHAVHEQGISVSLAVSESILKGRGAWRVHGGGFAGTIQAFVPNDLLDEYAAAMKAIFGENSCHELIIRPYGSLKLDIA